MAEQVAIGSEIARALAARGVRTVFGIPGVHNVELYRGLEESGITHVLARHEQGAGFMADGYARASGQPGVAFVISGPGLTNILTPVGQAYSDSVPLLVISACLPRGQLGMGYGQLHEMRDQEGAGEAVAQWSRTADTADALWDLIDRAIADFGSRRPRPVHIQVPLDLLEGTGPSAPAALTPPPPPRPDPAAVEEAAGLLREAKRPLLIVGGGAWSAADALPELIARAGLAVFPTYAAKGLIGDGHPRSFGPTLARPGSAEIIGSADLVVALGTELAEPDFWRQEPGISGTLLRIDIDPNMLADRHRADSVVLSDAGAFVRALLEVLEPQATTWEEEAIADARTRLVADALAERPGVAAVLPSFAASCPEDAIVVADMTQFAYLGNEVHPTPRGGRWLHPVGFGTLGYAMPAAIGAKLAAPERPVIAVAGDYGFQYTVQELATAVELGLSLPILIWDNGKLGEIEEDMVRKQIAPNAVVARNPDFLALARAYGAEAIQPARYEDIPAAVAQALAASVPTLIHVRADLG
ncbi:MAG: 5-guanidino-2-oxopentanoate decarboxylase [Pseudomonadota bacterium]